MPTIIILIYRFTYITGVPNPRTASIMLRGPTVHVVRTMHGYANNQFIILYRAVTNALYVLRNTFEDCALLPGAGAIDMALASYIRKIGDSEKDVTEKRIFHGFANALECVPRALIQNSAFPAHKVISSWRMLYENQKQLVFGVFIALTFRISTD